MEEKIENDSLQEEQKDTEKSNVSNQKENVLLTFIKKSIVHIPLLIIMIVVCF